MMASSMDPSSVSVKDLIDERVKLRENQLISEIDAEVATRRAKASDHLSRRFRELSIAAGAEDPDETISAIFRHKVSSSDSALEGLNASIASSSGQRSVDRTTGVPDRISVKLNELWKDIELFTTACDMDIKDNLSSTMSGEEWVLPSETGPSKASVEMALSALSQLENSMNPDKKDAMSSLRNPNFSSHFRVGVQNDFNELKGQIESLMAAHTRLSGCNIQRIIDASLAKMDDEYLSLLAQISKRVYSIREGSSGPSPQDTKLVIRTLPLLLSNQPVLIERVIDAVESFIDTNPANSKAAGKFVDLFFRKVHRDRYR